MRVLALLVLLAALASSPARADDRMDPLAPGTPVVKPKPRDGGGDSDRSVLVVVLAAGSAGGLAAGGLLVRRRARR